MARHDDPVLRLLLARHGETEWNAAGRYQGQADPPLNQRGRRQASCLTARVAGRKIDAVYTSDLKRAQETAAIMGKMLHRKPVPDPRLREISFGVLEGLTFAEANARYAKMMAAWLEDGRAGSARRQQAPPGGEMMEAFSQRLLSLLEELKGKHGGQRVLLVTHGGAIRELLRLALGLPPQGQWYFMVDNGSLSQLELYGDRPLLRHLNDTSHLEDAQ